MGEIMEAGSWTLATGEMGAQLALGTVGQLRLQGAESGSYHLMKCQAVCSLGDLRG